MELKGGRCIGLATLPPSCIHHHQLALQPGVGLGLRYNMPPGLSVPCSVSPFVYTHLSQIHGHVIQPSLSWSSSSSCCIQLSVQHLFGFAVSCILSICPSHLILWHLINLTMFSTLIMDLHVFIFLKS